MLCETRRGSECVMTELRHFSDRGGSGGYFMMCWVSKILLSVSSGLQGKTLAIVKKKINKTKLSVLIGKEV